MSIKKLIDVVKREWNLPLADDVDLDLELIDLAESIACETENMTIDEVYKINIGHPNLHLPGLIAVTIASELNLDLRKTNIHTTLREIINQK